MSLLTQIQQLTAQSARDRAVLWPVTVTLSTDDDDNEIACSGTPPTATRQGDDLRTGFITRTLRTIMLTRAQLDALSTTPTVALGTEFTIVADTHNPALAGTVWRCFDFGQSNGGAEIRCVCFKLD